MEKNSVEPEMQDDELDREDLTLFAQIQLGEDARTFVNSSIGQYVLAGIKQDIQRDLELLYKTAQWRRRKCLKIRADIDVKKNFLLMLNEAFTIGDLAHQSVLNKMQSE